MLNCKTFNQDRWLLTLSESYVKVNVVSWALKSVVTSIYCLTKVSAFKEGSFESTFATANLCYIAVYKTHKCRRIYN